MSRERFESRRQQFSTAVARLSEAVEDYLGRDRLAAAGFDPERAERMTRDSVIQRFEFAYELGWKTLKDWLQDQGVQAATPKQALGAAFESRLIADLAGWSDIHEMRNLTSHLYDEDKAKEVAEFISRRGLSLFKTLTERLDQA
jgi:nucleotidyltransferase substrate binding protein (TIGR01987 family)